MTTNLATSASTNLATNTGGSQGALAVNPGTDSGVWVSAAITLNATGAFGGAAPYTYLWSVVSGGTGTFSDATSLTSTFTATSVGSIVLKLTATDAVSRTASANVTIAATWDAVITNGTGFTRHVWIEVSAGTVTLNGANVSQINDRWAGAYHCVQATASKQPLYVATGGPNNLPYITPNSVDDALRNTSISLSAARRLRFYKVLAQASSGVTTVLTIRRTSTEAVVQMYSDATDFHMYSIANGEAAQDKLLTSHPLDTAWHAVSLQYLATGTVGFVDGTAIAPAFTGSPGAAAIEVFDVAGDTFAAGGKFYLLIFVEDAAAAVDTFIRAYITAQTGLAA